VCDSQSCLADDELVESQVLSPLQIQQEWRPGFSVSIANFIGKRKSGQQQFARSQRSDLFELEYEYVMLNLLAKSVRFAVGGPNPKKDVQAVRTFPMTD
jgi:hypothetical protein